VTTSIDLSRLAELLGVADDGLVHGCGCGIPHPPATSSLTADPARWRRIRSVTLDRDGHRCQYPSPGSGIAGRDGVTEVCGKGATVAGHVLARTRGGCDRPGNLRAECKPHSDSDSGRLTDEELAALNLARALAARVVTHGDDPVLSEGSSALDPGLKNLSLSARSQANAQVSGSTPTTPNMNLGLEDTRPDPLDTYPAEFVTVGDDGVQRIDPDVVIVPGPDDPCWDAAPWLDKLRKVPAEGSWPRLMTLPHPRAVGTYGPEALEAHARMTNGGRLRWWQRLAVYRLLEHDADGMLVWPEFIESTARQCGKSVGIRALAGWRILKAPERWGDQLVLHTGRELGIVREVLLPAWSWAERNGLEAARNNLNPGISTGPFMTGSRWVIRAKNAAYGLSPGEALVDEAWDVPAITVDEAIEPTLVEQISYQLGLFSTAHRKATGLVLERRASALLELFAPESRLLLEWSPLGAAPRDQPATWRAASPHWSAGRERLVRSALVKVLRGESVDPEEPDPISSFDAQWLNRWPNVVKIEKPSKDEPLVDARSWQRCLDGLAQPAPDGLLVVAVEDDLGDGAAAAAAALTPDGRVVVGGYRFGTRREAVDWAQDTSEAVDDAILLVGASMIDDAELEGVEVPIEPAGAAETRSGLPLLRELVRTLQVAHDGGADTVSAVNTARVRPGTAGAAILLTGKESTSLVRCIAWAVQRAHRDRG